MATERYFIGHRLLGEMRDTISRVRGEVYRVGGGYLPGFPLDIPRQIDSGTSSAVRAATYTGEWPISTEKEVTFTNQGVTPGTANVTNTLIELPSAGERSCIVAADGDTWYLVNWQQDIAYAAVDATLSDTSLDFATAPVAAVATSSTVTFSVSVETCASS
jgi:hypothetical protein